MNIKKAICLLMVAALIPAFSGCWYAAAGGAGAYGGYKAKEKGYTVQNPVKKESKKKQTKKTEKEESTKEESTEEEDK
jgi:hypothetical protein